MIVVHILFAGFVLLMLFFGGISSSIGLLVLWAATHLISKLFKGSKGNSSPKAMFSEVTEDMISTKNGRVNVSDAKSILKQLLKGATILDAEEIRYHIEDLTDAIRDEAEMHKDDLQSLKDDLKEQNETLKELKAHLKRLDKTDEDEIEDTQINIEDAAFEINALNQQIEDSKKEAATFRSDKKKWLIDYLNNLRR